MTCQSVLPAVVLIPLSLMPTFLGDADRAYVVAALLLSSGFAWSAGQLALRRSIASARRLLLVSIVYLPALLIVFMADKMSLAGMETAWAERVHTSGFRSEARQRIPSHGGPLQVAFPRRGIAPVSYRAPRRSASAA